MLITVATAIAGLCLFAACASAFFAGLSWLQVRRANSPGSPLHDASMFTAYALIAGGVGGALVLLLLLDNFRS